MGVPLRSRVTTRFDAPMSAGGVIDTKPARLNASNGLVPAVGSAITSSSTLAGVVLAPVTVTRAVGH